MVQKGYILDEDTNLVARSIMGCVAVEKRKRKGKKKKLKKKRSYNKCFNINKCNNNKLTHNNSPVPVSTQHSLSKAKPHKVTYIKPSQLFHRFNNKLNNNRCKHINMQMLHHNQSFNKLHLQLFHLKIFIKIQTNNFH